MKTSGRQWGREDAGTRGRKPIKGALLQTWGHLAPPRPCLSPTTIVTYQYLDKIRLYGVRLQPQDVIPIPFSSEF
jgi:hypothetical protein